MFSRLKRIEIWAFATLVVSRLAWVFISGIKPDDFQDTQEYIELSTRAMSGNFDFSLPRFIRPPAYPIQIALTRMVFGDHWMSALVAENVVFSIATGILIYLLTRSLTGGDRRASAFATLIYATSLSLLYYVPMIATETTYAFWVLLVLFLFDRFLKNPRVATLLGLATSFYVAAMVRSQMLVTLPVFAAVMFWQTPLKRSLRFAYSAALVALFAVLTLPFGLVNLRTHGSYTVSSNGGNFLLLNSNSVVGYLDGAQYGDLSPEVQDRVKNFYENGTYFFGPDFDRISKLGQTEKQKEFRRIAFEWIKTHPKQFIELKFRNLGRLMLPGQSWAHIPLTRWLISFIAGLPLTILAVFGLIRVLKSQPADKRRYTMLFGYLIASSTHLVLLLYTYRYRVFSIDFVLTIFAGIGLSALAALKTSAQGAKSAASA